MHAPRDDLGHEVPLSGPATRVVSLVPSLTEAVAATAPAALVGATQWCTHPEGLRVTRVRGTKNPDLNAIGALRPDLVIANQEENRQVDVERLRSAGIPVWVTRIDSVDDALSSLRRLFADGFDIFEPAWLRHAADAWSEPPTHPGLTVAAPVWRDPWIWAGGATYINDVIARLGWTNVGALRGDRYPQAAVSDVLADQPDLILLPDEPYHFHAGDGPEAFGETPSVLVPGRALSWYGPAMGVAKRTLEEAVSG